MNYASDMERLTLEEQQALAYLVSLKLPSAPSSGKPYNYFVFFQFANLFENASTSEWLLYISEWQFCGNTLSNIRTTVKVAVNALLSDLANLQSAGAAIIHNMACKEVKTVVGISDFIF